MIAATPTKTSGRMIHGGGPDVCSDVKKMRSEPDRSTCDRKLQDADDEHGEHDREVHRVSFRAAGPEEADSDAEE